MERITVPRINANEDTYILAEACVSNGAWVEKGKAIAVIASLKTSETVEAPNGMYICYLVSPSSNVQAGEAFAVGFESPDEMEAFQREKLGKKENAETRTAPYVLTKLARTFADEHQISQEEIASLGKKLVKTEDLKNLLNQREKKGRSRGSLTPNQIAVAASVTESHREVPQAFQLMKVNCGKCQELLKDCSKHIGISTGYEAALVMILRELFPNFPLFFSKYIGNGNVEIPKSASIGITMDAGNGLFVPVVKAGQGESVEDVARILYRFKVQAIEGNYAPDDLADGSISIALNTGKNVVSVVPLILPGQSAILSVCSPVKELALDAKGNVVEELFLYLGLAYDHRVVNGMQAMQFMERIAKRLEDADVPAESRGC